MNEVSTNNSIKEYYIQLKQIADNAVTLLNGINSSFTSYSPEVHIQLVNSDGTVQSVAIPSFLYLENKIEELETSMNLLFNLPKSGEAWFTKEANMFKLNMVQSNVAPPIPILNYNPNNGFNIKDNNFFKDLVSPKTYLKFDVSNFPNNIHDVLVKKIVLHNSDLINDIFSNNDLITYTDYKEKLYLMNEGIDYSEYDSKISVPLKEVKYKSRFEILDIPKDSNSENPYYDDELKGMIYTVRLNTLNYYDANDNSIVYKLQPIKDFLTLENHYNIFQVLSYEEYSDYDNENNKEYIVKLLEVSGHIVLDTTESNSNMWFVKYDNPNESTDKYIEIPLEENPYIIVFVSSIYNNVKSNWSNAIKLNLNEIVINDGVNGKLSYVEYYNKYCKNLGDIIYSIGDVAYSQLVEYNNQQLRELTMGKPIKQLVTETLGKENNSVLNISAINTHLVDDEISNNLATLYKQKIELNNELTNINSNIDTTYNQLINTDFSLDSSVSQAYLKSQLDSYYAERLKYQQQILSIINNIDLIKNDIVGYDSLKYRVRGVTNAQDINESGVESEITAYLKANYGVKCQLIGLEVEYKYKNIKSNTSSVENNSNTIFTDWVRVNNIDKQRYLKFNEETNAYTIEFTNYDTNANIIKWNQIDIPISVGEDVVIRIRYKYSIGQPFINIYTPWSDEVTVTYSSEDAANVTDISAILEANEQDLINSKFLSELITGGYQEHITNKIIDNSQVYYHMPENIYSGFNTSENKLISLKDKLIEIENSINEYKSYINNELASEYKVFLQYDDNMIELSKNTLNTINFKNQFNHYDGFIRKDMNLIIKNTGTTAINLYSLFPGNMEIPLLHTNIQYYNTFIGDYERVPLLIENIIEPEKSVFPQVMGQWIYFRQNNPYTKEYLYNINDYQNQYDTNNLLNNKDLTLTSQSMQNFISGNNKQLLLGYRNRNSEVNSNSWGEISINGDTASVSTMETSINNITSFINQNTGLSKFIYTPDNSKSLVLKYEHLKYETEVNGNKNTVYISTETSISEIYQNTTLNGLNINDINGSFLIPNLLSPSQIVCDNELNNQYKKLNVGESLTIPILFEYYLTDSFTNSSITKTLAFDLRPSLTRQLDNYIFRIIISRNLTDDNNSEYVPKIINDTINEQ